MNASAIPRLLNSVRLAHAAGPAAIRERARRASVPQGPVLPAADTPGISDHPPAAA